MWNVSLAFGFGGICFLVIGIMAWRRPSTGLYLFKRIARHRLSRQRPYLAGENEIAVLLCGTGSPLPDPKRAGPSALIAAGDKLFVIDAGSASVRNLLLWRVPLGQLEGVFVTHFHSDHIAELGELNLQSWVAGRSAPLKVYGPPGIERVIAGFNQAYAHDTAYRTLHHGADLLALHAAGMEAITVTIPPDNGTGVVLEADGVKITAIRVKHDPVKPAYGYRFDFRGRSIVISGDTAADQNLATAAKGADVLVHDALNPQMVKALEDALTRSANLRAAKIMQDIPGYHASPLDAASIANTAGVRLLVFTHMVPMLPNQAAERMFLNGVRAARPHGVELGHDGRLIRLPGNSTVLQTTTLQG